MEYFSRQSNIKSCFGFTLPELMITLAVAAILLAHTLPSMKSLIENQRVASVTREVFSSLMLARSEAVKRQNTVSVCSSLNGNACDQTNFGWQHGWLVFSDEKQDGIFNDNDQLIQSVPTQSGQVEISWNRGFSLSFNSQGQVGSAGTFEVCEADSVRAIIISLTGRARVEERDVCS